LIEPGSALEDAPPQGAFVHKAQLLHDASRAVIVDEYFAEDALDSARAERFVDQGADRFGRVAFP
jgi:hypothetical protein